MQNGFDHRKLKKHFVHTKEYVTQKNRINLFTFEFQNIWWWYKSPIRAIAGVEQPVYLNF
jgi:hypothetical protein